VAPGDEKAQLAANQVWCGAFPTFVAYWVLLGQQDGSLLLHTFTNVCSAHLWLVMGVYSCLPRPMLTLSLHLLLSLQQG